jgi:hypothetical protein
VFALSRHHPEQFCRLEGNVKMTTLPEIIGAFVSDSFGLLGIPGGSVSEALVVRYFRRRTEMARDILFEELRHANISDAQAASEDDGIAVIVRYLRAAREGVARLNLRLLAKAIAGKLQSGRLVADEFLQYAEALASLSRGEIMVIGTMYRIWAAHQALAATDPGAAMTRYGYGADWSLTLDELTQKGMSEELVITGAAKAQRTGLIYGLSLPPGTSRVQNDFVYRVSPLLAELGKTVDFEDAFRREAREEE